MEIIFFTALTPVRGIQSAGDHSDDGGLWGEVTADWLKPDQQTV